MANDAIRSVALNKALELNQVTASADQQVPADVLAKLQCGIVDASVVEVAARLEKHICELAMGDYEYRRCSAAELRQDDRAMDAAAAFRKVVQEQFDVEGYEVAMRAIRNIR